MKKVDLTKGKVLSVILALALPIMGSSVLQLTYNLVDMLLVGRLGSDAVASIGSSSFLIGLGYAIQASVVVGTGIKVAHAVGKKDEVEQAQYISAGFILNAIIGFAFVLILIFGGKSFILFLDLQNESVERQSYQYLLVSAPMLFFAFFNLWYVRLYNSFGQNKNALKISAIGVVMNIILDPLFIYVFKLGVFGAGLATLMANLTMTALFYYQSKALFNINLKQKIPMTKYIDILKLGFPTSLQRFLFTLVNIGLAKMIANFGSDAIAAQKIGLQIESITYMVIGGLNGAITGFVGQNYGAKQFKRIQQGMKVALTVGVIYAALTTVIFNIWPEFLASLFVKEQKTITIAADYLRIVGLSQVFMAIEIICNGMFTGLGLPKIPAVISIVFTVLRIPMAFIFIQRFGVNGIWLSIGLSSVIKGLVAFSMYLIKVWKGDLNALETEKIM
ncbi:MAG TPA: MATE family efflux transporter [Firmicutes bacterium]|nr:MATE family efflux transporter [Bacillota bacterium]